MIKPQDVDFSSPEAVLLSTEAQRFQGYDLEAEGAEREVIEEHEDYDLVQVTLPVNEGTIKRLIKAFKNGEVVEVPPVPEEPAKVAVNSVDITGPVEVTIGEEVVYTYSVNPANADVESAVWETNNGIIEADGTLLPEIAGEATVRIVVNGVAYTKTIVVKAPVVETETGEPLVGENGEVIQPAQ